MTLATFIQASAHRLDGIADGSVQAIVCSPPYYGLRAYQGDQNVEWPTVEYAPMPGLPPIRIAGCEPGREHEWVNQPPRKPGQVEQTKWKDAVAAGAGQTQGMGAYCAKCGGWRGGLGNEPTLEAYIGHLILCLREWRRVLRPDGVCFVNLGDSYSGSGVGGGGNRKGNEHGQHDVMLVIGRLAVQGGLKPKDLMMVPARFALAAQADGWWLRSDIIGHKIAPMPESVTDRPTRSHEHIFMLTKSARYYWDAEGVKEEGKDWGGRKREIGEYFTNGVMPNGAAHHGLRDGNFSEKGRNMRDVIEWRPSPFPGAHFAVWPEAIPEKLIRAATSERGACPHCGAPWRRVVETPKIPDEVRNRGNGSKMDFHSRSVGSRQKLQDWRDANPPVTTGFEPSCACPPHEPTPCVILDPFSGSGTTAKVAVRLGRRAIGVDIASEYLDEVTAQRFGAGVQMELVSA